MPVLTLAVVADAMKRWGPKIVVAVLVAVSTWFAFQSWRMSNANTVLAGRLASETTRANSAEADLVDARARILRADAAARADQERIRGLEAAIASSKESIDALETRYGARPVGDLTRAHLERLRRLQDGR